MLQIQLPLAATSPQLKPADFELAPYANVEVQMNGNQRCVNIMLKGVISGASTETLRQFLDGVSDFIGNKWTLQMDELIVLSGRGIKILVEFARRLRRRGIALQICGINQSVYRTLKDLNLTRAFAWAD